jgi:hypothetical protein
MTWACARLGDLLTCLPAGSQLWWLTDGDEVVTMALFDSAGLRIASPMQRSTAEAFDDSFGLKQQCIVRLG